MDSNHSFRDGENAPRVHNGLSWNPILQVKLIEQLCLFLLLSSHHYRRSPDPIPNETNHERTPPSSSLFNGIRAKLPPLITRLAVEGQIRSLLSNPLRLGMQPSLTLYWL